MIWYDMTRGEEGEKTLILEESGYSCTCKDWPHHEKNQLPLLTTPKQIMAFNTYESENKNISKLQMVISSQGSQGKKLLIFYFLSLKWNTNVALHFHVSYFSALDCFPCTAVDDAMSLKWSVLTHTLVRVGSRQGAGFCSHEWQWQCQARPVS